MITSNIINKNCSNNALKLALDSSSVDFKFNISLFLFVFWSFIETIMAMQFLPLWFITSYGFLKVLAPAVITLFCLFLYFKQLKSNILFVVFFSLGAYESTNSAFNLLFSAESNWSHFNQSIMTLLWSIMIFLIAPAVFDNLTKIHKLLWYSAILMVIVVILGSIWIIVNGFEIGRIYGGSRQGASRYSFAYLSPGYAGSISFTIICSTLILKEFVNTKFTALLLNIFIILAILSIVLAGSRTYILSTLFIFFYVYLHKYDLMKKLCICSFLVLIFYSIYLYWSGTNVYSTFNNYSSNRLDIWESNVVRLLGDQIEDKFFTGIALYSPDWNQSLEVAEGAATKSFTRFAIDNVYLEMLIMHGLIGLGFLFLFMQKTIAMFRKINNMAENIDISIYNLSRVTYGIILSIFIGALFNSHFPSFGNTINSLLFPSCISLLFIFNRVYENKYTS